MLHPARLAEAACPCCTSTSASIQPHEHLCHRPTARLAGRSPGEPHHRSPAARAPPPSQELLLAPSSLTVRPPLGHASSQPCRSSPAARAPRPQDLSPSPQLTRALTLGPRLAGVAQPRGLVRKQRAHVGRRPAAPQTRDGAGLLEEQRVATQGSMQEGDGKIRRRSGMNSFDHFLGACPSRI
ncbi:hypothetical protein PVAP13_4NG215599 [Panicum virgatum]|uniref:Uncharacterized protein n=1 Tax=Panicum virgatum TaxID=38727 RepID=A0A8T0TBZ0_PANVG|nr:hypothetical protein PVAP13_4NG215599 [Panicum virgatum]